MKRHSLSQRLRLLFGLCLLIGAIGVPIGVSAMHGTQNAPPQDHQRDHGTWSYSAGRDKNGRLEARVRYDDMSISSLRAYAAANRDLAMQLARESGPIEVQVTFRDPLALDVFRTWATANGMAVEAVDIRTVNKQGGRSTLAVFPRGANSLPQNTVDRQLVGASQSAGPLTIRGVIDARGTVDAAQLAAVLADPRVFLADVTFTIIRRELAADGVPDAGQAHIVVPAPFWQMEERGLENFR